MPQYKQVEFIIVVAEMKFQTTLKVLEYIKTKLRITSCNLLSLLFPSLVTRADQLLRLPSCEGYQAPSTGRAPSCGLVKITGCVFDSYRVRLFYRMSRAEELPIIPAESARFADSEYATRDLNGQGCADFVDQLVLRLILRARRSAESAHPCLLSSTQAAARCERKARHANVGDRWRGSKSLRGATKVGAEERRARC